MTVTTSSAVNARDLFTITDRIDQIFRKYNDELLQLARQLRRVYHRIQKDGFRASFGDGEGEILYCLLRELRPSLVFEISPDCGWSTNYLLAALTANAHGRLHSFELEKTKKNQPTEKVIHRYLLPYLDRSRLICHIGDARDSVQQIPGDVDFLFLDSCHEDWFAQWYTEKLFGRVRGVVFIQDIAFIDGLEPSSEAAWMWRWFKENKISFELISVLEQKLKQAPFRQGYAPRRRLRSNSVVFPWPPQHHRPVPLFEPSLEDRLAEADRAIKNQDHKRADAVLNDIVMRLEQRIDQVNRHRFLIRAGQLYQQMGEEDEAERVFQKALGVVLLADRQQRLKGLIELFNLFIRVGRAGLLMQTIALIGTTPGARREFLKNLWLKARHRLTRRAIQVHKS